MTVITGDQTTQYKPNPVPAVIDATAATFHIIQTSRPYPIALVNAPSGCMLTLGTVVADDISQTSDWKVEYAQGNSAAVRFENSPDATLRGAHKAAGGAPHIEGCWDGIRPSGTACNGLLVEGIYAKNVRDDFVENDACNTMTIRDCLVDGAQNCCISTTDGGSTTRAIRTVTIENSVFGAGSYLTEGVSGQHGGPFKVNKSGIGYNPRFVVNNSVFMIRNPAHNTSEPGGRLSVAFAGMEGSGNFWLNYSDTPISAAYAAMIPAGFTLLQGQAARDMWATKRDAWLVGHGFKASETPPVEPPTDEDDMALEALNAAVAALNTDVAAMKTAIAENTAAITALQGQVATPTDLAPVLARLTALESFDTKVKDLG
jgi:hypothetical protein